MARFYSPEWITAFNGAVADLAPTPHLGSPASERGAVTPAAEVTGGGDGDAGPPPSADRSAGPGGEPGDRHGEGTVGGRSRFRVAQVVTGAPDGDFSVVLEVDGDRLHLERAEPGRHPGGATGAGQDAGPGGGPEGGPDVTVVLSYADAGALSRGEVDAAQLIGTGRLKVRGNLSLLVAGQALLAAAAERLAPLAGSTTY